MYEEWYASGRSFEGHLNGLEAVILRIGQAESEKAEETSETRYTVGIEWSGRIFLSSCDKTTSTCRQEDVHIHSGWFSSYRLLVAFPNNKIYPRFISSTVEDSLDVIFFRFRYHLRWVMKCCRLFIFKISSCLIVWPFGRDHPKRLNKLRQFLSLDESSCFFFFFELRFKSIIKYSNIDFN